MTNKKSEDRYNRLPRWAEMELKTLSDELAKCRKQLAEIRGDSTTDTHLLIRSGSRTKRIPLPKGAKIEFTLSDGKVEVFHYDTSRIAIVDTLAGHLVLQPKSDN